MFVQRNRNRSGSVSPGLPEKLTGKTRLSKPLELPGQKDGKHQQPQIMIGLLVNSHGYPIGYQIFEGNTSETKTLIPVLETFQKKFFID
ncbi:MAG: transposase, partial [Prolixibacteraceae bacterium]|nr:transposase [Prolixibacteraceae bacterium]